ncbi:MFS transporter [Aestuariivivens sp. NBU2969]|uniref:MFS transporter n=1 Tax=Aestuariivivens sp. NBU2969 TaxID=2873267 RepID=UPI001CC13390|nr:MFS transporter [Aestuariivivens sp. NBU2969]
MAHYKTNAKDRVPVGQKTAFGAGHFVLNLLPGALSFFMFFLLTAFGMEPLYAGILGALPRFFDAFTDPIMGFISDNTNSRWGRRRPYIFIGAIASGILFMVLWQLDETNSQTYNFWYFLILSILFIIGNTIYATPLVGLGYEMTSDYNERTRLMAYANTIGQIAWMIVPWFWVIIADPNLFDNQAEGVREMSVYVALVCVVLGVLPAFFCKGIDSSAIENRKEITLKTLGKNLIQLFKSIMEVAKNKPFVKLCGATFLVFNGFQMVAAFSVYIIVFYMYNGSYENAGTWPAWFSTITALITAFFVIPIISKIASLVGKRKAFIIATLISIVGYIMKWWGFDVGLNQEFNETAFAQSLNKGLGGFFEMINPFLESLGMTWFSIDTSQGVPWLIFVPVPLIAFGMGSLFTLMMSMTADVCDLDELKNGMPRKEGTFGAIYWWMVKIGQSIALFLGGLVLQLVGFISDAPVQTAETMHSLRIADIIIPSITAAFAIWVMWSYSLSEERAREIKAKLIERRGEL